MRENEQVNLRQDDVLDLLEKLKILVTEARGVLLSDNCMVQREVVLGMLGMITNNLPTELKNAKWIVENQYSVIREAEAEAGRIIADAEERAVAMIHEHEIYQQAKYEAETLMRKAEAEAAQMRRLSVEYVNDRLTLANDALKGVLIEIRRSQEEIQRDLIDPEG